MSASHKMCYKSRKSQQRVAFNTVVGSASYQRSGSSVCKSVRTPNSSLRHWLDGNLIWPGSAELPSLRAVPPAFHISAHQPINGARFQLSPFAVGRFLPTTLVLTHPDYFLVRAHYFMFSFIEIVRKVELLQYYHAYSRRRACWSEHFERRRGEKVF